MFPALETGREKGGHVSNPLLHKPIHLAEGQYLLRRKKVNAHGLCLLIGGPSRGASEARTFNLESKQAEESCIS